MVSTFDRDFGNSTGPSVDGPAVASERPRGASNGLPLEAYAAANALSEAEVWRRLRRGQLVARHDGERLLVYEELPAEPTDFSLKDLHATLAKEEKAADVDPFTADSPEAASPRGGPGAVKAELEPGDLPPLPGTEARPGASSKDSASGAYLALSGRRTETPELALLLDHLSLAKEENREILRLTQDSIRKVTELTDSIVEMKDTVIEAKDAQILALEQRLRAAEGEIKNLRQHNEDLDTLARAALADAQARRPTQAK